MKNYIMIFAIMVILASCGKSKEEIAKIEKNKQDSINLVIEKAKQDAAQNERIRIEQEKQKEMEAKKAEEMKRYSIDELVGTWNVNMKCLNSNCSGTNTGDRRSETWNISFESRIIKVKVIGNQNTNNDYTGTFNGKELNLTANIVENNFFSNSTVATTIVKLTMSSNSELVGKREVVRKDPCKTEYSLTAKKQ